VSSGGLSFTISVSLPFCLSLSLFLFLSPFVAWTTFLSLYTMFLFLSPFVAWTTFSSLYPMFLTPVMMKIILENVARARVCLLTAPQVLTLACG
jgi:hypothetical protein